MLNVFSNANCSDVYKDVLPNFKRIRTLNPDIQVICYPLLNSTETVPLVLGVDSLVQWPLRNRKGLLHGDPSNRSTGQCDGLSQHHSDSGSQQVDSYPYFCNCMHTVSRFL